MISKVRLVLFGFFALVFVQQAVAQDPADTEQLGTSEKPLAMQGDAVLTQAEIDAAFNKIRPEMRLPYIRNGEMVNRLISTLLSNRILAEEARKANYDQDPLIRNRQLLAAEKELADAWMEKVMREAPATNFETSAYETYLANPEAWKSEEKVDVSHILISSETRPPEEAEELVISIREQIIADPEVFDNLVEEYSEDPSKEVNGGRFPEVKRGDMVKPFEDTAFAMEVEGEISLPVETQYGFHIIRLNRRLPGVVPPFEQIKAQAVEHTRENYLKEYRRNYLRKLLSVPIEYPDGAIEDMVKRYFGENLELAPEFSQ
jgi:peptidyl-prolyl cis-trans isomerase C